MERETVAGWGASLPVRLGRFSRRRPIKGDSANRLRIRADPPTDSPARTIPRSDAGPLQVGDSPLIPHDTCVSRMPGAATPGVRQDCCWPAWPSSACRGGGGGNRSGLAPARLIPDRGCGPPQPCRSARERRSVPNGGVTERDILKALPSLRSDCSPSIGTVFTFAGICKFSLTG